MTEPLKQKAKNLERLKTQLEQAKLDEISEYSSENSHEDVQVESACSAGTEQLSVLIKVRSWIGKTSNPPMDQTKKNRMTDNLRKKQMLTEQIVPEAIVIRKYMAEQALYKECHPLTEILSIGKCS